MDTAVAPTFYTGPLTMAPVESSQIAAIGYDAASLTLGVTFLEGTMRANVGDWIIRGVKGELYPCKPDIFKATYEPVAEAAEAAR